MSQGQGRRLRQISLGATDFVLDSHRVLGVESPNNVQRNPTDHPPWGWLLGIADGLEVHCLEPQGFEPQSDDQILLLERQNGERWALLTHRSGDEIEVDGSAIVSITPRLAREPYTALVQTEDGAKLLLDVDRLHPADRPEAPQPLASSPTSLATAPLDPPSMVWVPLDKENRTHLVVSSRQVVEIAPPLPQAPTFASTHPLSGFVLYDGQAVPCLDLSLAFGVQPPLRNGERTLIVRSTRSLRLAALPMTDTLRTVELPVTSTPLPLQGRGSRWMRGMFESESGLLVVPDLDILTS